ncbi:MAG: immunoglobulin domain-containing protein, partial [Limisphaerales bacterium]
TAGPASQTLVQGTNVTLTVTASGTSPLIYQWYVNNSVVAGATSATLTLNNVQASQAGSYTVAVTNVAGSATSGAAVLTVNVAPTIAVGPASQTVVQGTNVTLTVTASGTSPLIYQWYVNSSPVAGATNATLTLNNVQASQAGSYTVAVTNVAGSATSGAAVLTVNVPPSITTQPHSQTASLGASASFSVTAVGTESLHYQWRLNGMDLLGATNAALVLNRVQAVNSGDYTVIVSNSVGAVTSTRATLVVETSVQLISLGESGSGFFQIKLFGTTGSSYVLQASTDLLNWASVLTGTVAQTSLTFTDTNSVSFEHRFYRVVSSP